MEDRRGVDSRHQLVMHQSGEEEDGKTDRVWRWEAGREAQNNGGIY